MPKPAAADPLILLANCHKETNDVMDCVLWTRGYIVHTVETLRDAAAFLVARRYDLLIARNAMPDGCGADLLETAWKRFSVPGLFMTSTLEGQQLAAKITPAACKGVLMIPFAPSQLFTLVETAMGQRAPVNTPPGRTCPDCHGSGQIALLVRRVPCERCKATGRITPANLDLPMRLLQAVGLRTRMRLDRAGIHTLRHAARMTDAQLKNVPGINDAAVADVRKAVERFKAEEKVPATCA